MSNSEIRQGSPRRMGVSLDDAGANFAVFSEHASAIDLCLFDAEGRETRLPLPERTGSVWHGYVPGLAAGQRYGFRAHGLYAPEQGHRFNPHKLLLDPYTREMAGGWTNDPATYGYDIADPSADLSFSTADSAPFVPKSVISDPASFLPPVEMLREAPQAELIYEAHAKGLTMLHPQVAEHLRGTYEGLASDAIIEHLHKLGVTAIELLPVHGFLDDGFLIEKGLRNYWGYNTIAFFAPEPRYFGPEGLIGFRRMVQRFHDAGIQVILDVVYNHTAEGDQRGQTLCYRGLDNASYYKLIDGKPRFYVNDAGTGNALNVIHPYVLRMVMDSLRFWVSEMGVDGFRFDLATSLGRESYGFDPNGGFFDALRQDPVLSQARLIAEPWDLGPGGYQLGNFPFEFSEWNDTFRDTVRRYWKGDAHSTQELGARLLGSADKFDRHGRRAWASVNFITSHDGFTLNDLVSYNQRHNEANLEDGRDGHSENYSDNCGHEGPTDDAVILARRARRSRNMLATMFLSQGTPMLLAGDGLANSQGGNNNAYCQDNEIGWITWDSPDPQLVDFVARLSAFRRAHATVRQAPFLHGNIREEDGQPDVVWRDFEGQPLDWRDPGLSRFCLLKRASAEATSWEDGGDGVFLVFNRGGRRAEVVMPDPGQGRHWVRHIDTANPNAAPQALRDGNRTQVQGVCVVAFALESDG